MNCPYCGSKTVVVYNYAAVGDVPPLSRKRLRRCRSLTCSKRFHTLEVIQTFPDGRGRRHTHR